MLPAGLKGMGWGAIVARITCPWCGAQVEFHQTNCQCGRFVGFPNVRRAEEMRADLNRNYDAAIADATGRGVRSLVDELENILRGSVATINIDPKLLYNLVAGQNYVSYYKALSAGLRQIAERQYHAQRSKVDAVIHPGYEMEILNAALSPDGRGLTNYGPITLRLLEVSISNRASVMRENAFDFFERNKLGDRNAEEEPGWRSVWAGRYKLGVAHLASAMTSATAIRDIPNYILSTGATRTDDRYIEVHIWGSFLAGAQLCSPRKAAN
jgi:hypothetical protein